MTLYKLFQQTPVVAHGNDEVEAAGAWREVSEVQASSADAAIRAYVGRAKATEGVFVAVPVASFKPHAVTVEATPQVRVRPLAAPEPVASRKAPEPEPA